MLLAEHGLVDVGDHLAERLGEPLGLVGGDCHVMCLSCGVAVGWSGMPWGWGWWRDGRWAADGMAAGHHVIESLTPPQVAVMVAPG